MMENKIRFQPTPNPNSMKFVFNKPVVQGGMEMYHHKSETGKSPIAQKLFEIEGVEGVFMMQNFISVNKIPSGNWGVIVPKVMEVLNTHSIS